MSKTQPTDVYICYPDSQTIRDIVTRTLIDYDEDLTDDLYIIRSEHADQLGLKVAFRIQEAVIRLARRNRTTRMEGADDDQ